MSKEFRNEFLKSLNVLAPRIAASIERYGEETVNVDNITAAGDLTVVGDTSLSGNLLLTSADPGGDPAPLATFTRISATPADNDELGRIAFSGSNDAGAVLEYARITCEASDVSNGGEDGRIIFDVMKNSTMASMLEIKNNECVFNNFSKDTDFRIETDDETHFVFVDANANSMSIGDSTDAPAATLEVTNHATAGAYNLPLVQLNSNDTDKICLDINAANIDANVVDIAADGLTTAGAINLASNSSDNSARSLVTVHNNHASAVGATGLHVKNDAVASTAGQTVLFESTVASEDNPLLRLKNSNADANGPILRFENSAGADGTDDDYVGTISFYGEDDGTPSDVEYAKIETQATDVSSGAKNGSMVFTSMVANAAQEVGRINPESSTANTFLGGFGIKSPILELSSGTAYTLTGDQSGVIIMLNDAFSSGLTLTLPETNAANVGFHCTVIVAVNQTGTFKIATNADGDIFYGAIRLIRTSTGASRAFQPGASDDNIVFDANTKGRLEGSVYRLTIVGTNKILVDGQGVFAGTAATAFATS